MSAARGARGTAFVPRGQAVQLAAARDANRLLGRSLFVFGPASPFRRACAIVVDHVVFTAVMAATVVLSAVLIATSDPFATDPAYYDSLNIFVVAMFGLESALKIVADGLVLGRGAYLRDPMNAIDFVVFLAGVVDVIPSIPSVSLTALRALRLLRIVRALRFKAASGMQAIILTLIRGMPFILNIGVVLAFFVIAFAIIGLESLSASLRRRCVYASDPTRVFEAPEPEPATWCNVGNATKGGLDCASLGQGLVCRDLGYNPDFAKLQNFDRIWYAVYTVRARAMGDGVGGRNGRGVSSRCA